MLKLSYRRLVASISSILAFYSLARVCVLFLEAFAVVKDARTEDEELLELCARGEARGSAKFRDACIHAKADMASPIVFKAVVYAVSTAFRDFSDAVGSPFKLAVLVLFLVSSVVMPSIPWLRLVLGTYTPEEPTASANHFISFVPPPSPSRGRLRKKFGRAIKSLKMRTSPALDDIDNNGQEVVELEPGLTHGGGYDGSYGGGYGDWRTIDIGNGGHVKVE